MPTSDGRVIIESMFDVRLPDVEALGGFDDAGLVDAMREAARLESAVIARKFAAAARLYHRRLAEQGAEEREQWCIDGWEQVAAEVAAAQGISRGRAAGQLRYGLALAERLPKLGAVFAAGDVDFGVISAAVFRSELMTDDAALTRLDGWLARNASRWSRRSYRNIVEVLDYWIQKLEPAAVRVARQTEESRHISISPLRLRENLRPPLRPAVTSTPRSLGMLVTVVGPQELVHFFVRVDFICALQWHPTQLVAGRRVQCPASNSMGRVVGPLSAVSGFHGAGPVRRALGMRRVITARASANSRRARWAPRQ
jgi:Domain of unknown function (DUF222)